MGVYCLSGAAVFKAGAGVSGAGVLSQWETLIAQAESLINVTCRKNFSGAYANLDPAVKYILEEITSNIAGIYAINYDMSGYNSRLEAEDKINVLRDAALRGLSILRDKKAQDFIDDA